MITFEDLEIMMNKAGLKGGKTRDAVGEVFCLLRNNGTITLSSLKNLEEELGKPLLTGMVWMQYNGLVDVQREGKTHTVRFVE